MEIKRIIPNISSTKMEESREFYTNFLGLNIVMDMHWVLTFASPSNPTSQINIVKSEKSFVNNDHVTISIEVSDVDTLYEKAKELNFEIAYPLTNEPWGLVRRFWVKDPNGITINLMAHRQESA
jgi:predicted enzyme related to lactoylglutathione lyase